MNFNQTVRLSEQVLAQEVAGETVLLNLQSECYFSLDAVGTRVWQLLGANLELQAIYNTLLEEYEVEPPRLRADLEALIHSASESGLITLEDAP